nr:D-Ala-D-Ala carboxypeptidase family metallohydrolase [uncultured Sphingomonas sp.]
MTRLLLLLLVLIGLTNPTAAATERFDPAADYITAGQDEPGYRRWVAGAPWRATYVKAFNDYLTSNGVGGVAPTWQLLRTATDWQKCHAEPFEVPPTQGWPNIVAALRYVGAFVEPVIGPVEPVSVYRNDSLNSCAGGARESTHRTTGAVDMVPLRPVTREQLMTALCRVHLSSGNWNNVGLGFYKGLRFHIDSKKFREWGTAGAKGGWGCTAVMAEGARSSDAGSAAAVPPPTLSPGFKIVVPPTSSGDPLSPK